MCGILGSVNIPIDEKTLALLKHRGPDRQAILSTHVARNDIYMAHTRLSIVDLSEAGNQPMESECGNYVLIFNGEIYNHLKLRHELKFSEFKGHSDTETLLHLLIEQGVHALEKLNGIFAFAFLDKRKGKLLLARDSFGVKPVYFYKKSNRLVYSSEIRPIQRFVQSQLNPKSLGLLLSLRYVPSPYTLFCDIYKLRPGHYCVFTITEQDVTSEVRPFITRVSEPIDVSFGEAVDLYGEKLRTAVDRQLMGDVDMGILLSGGIDSAVIAGLASRKMKNMKAFTVGFDSSYKANEIEFAAETATYFGLEHHVVKMDASDFFNVFAECSRIVEEPLATTSFIPMYYLSKLASEFVKVVLTGQGADEPLGGYGRYQGELLKNKYPDFLFKVMRWLVRVSGTKSETLLRGARSLTEKDEIRRFMLVYSLFTPDEVRRMIGYDVQDSVCELLSYYYDILTKETQTSVDKMMSLDLRMDLADDLLMYTDKITMNFSLECRVPMLDIELIHYLESLPLSYKVKRGKTKIIHKAFAERFLPKSFIDRPKLGFKSPADIWFREKSEWVESILLNGKVADDISKVEISKIISQHKMGYNRMKQIFLLLSVNEWLKSQG